VTRALPVREVTDATSANAFVFGVLFNQGQRAEKSWRAPYALAERLGTLAPAALAAMPQEQLADALVGLHRFARVMARYLGGTAALLDRRYGGDARGLWRPAVPAGVLVARLVELPGVGRHKAEVGLFVLTVELGVPVLDDGVRRSIRAACPSLADLYEAYEGPVLRRTG
jgi:endonuclease III